ncbi:hypothetical protein [Endozoicomonas sp. GU-1]|uniref:hypothetical protein n=1 Tax=Endozoicomonas sp. GU-1 TaxID=3009078 RepID=UPI0022B402BE|nr:hypothetical protein [Endozoicomonas sp. GU-1]WBA83739.1 hypothetical protein O2T12_11785 [Endozoicomonas sp. GU-1]WBA86720.1 hypothetical protein O3276_01355 [Endozoicomonas sp. GU-1]
MPWALKALLKTEKLKGTTDFLGGLTKEFAKQTVEDAKDVRDALSGVYNSFADESKAAAKAAEDSAKTMTKSQKLLWQNFADEIVDGQKKVEESAADTAETVKSHFEDASDAISQVNASETRTELASLGVALAEAFSLGTLSAEEYYEATEASRRKLAKLKAEADNTSDSIEGTGDAAEEAGDKQAQSFESAQSIAGVMAGHYNAITAELQGMSAAAHDSFIAMQQGVGSVNTDKATGSIAELQTELAETRQRISDLQSAANSFDPTGIGRWFNETSIDAAYIKQQFLEQKIALEELIQSYEQGDISAASFARQGKDAAGTMKLLNESDLSRLNDQIEQAEESMQSLGETSRDTLSSLQDELDRLQGRQADIDRRRYESQQDELKEQRSAAQDSGNTEAVKNLTEAIRVSDAIYQEQIKQRREDQQSAARQTSQQSPGSSLPETARQTPQRIIRLEYPGGSVNVGVDSGDESALLNALQAAGMKTV